VSNCVIEYQNQSETKMNKINFQSNLILVDMSDGPKDKLSLLTDFIAEYFFDQLSSLNIKTTTNA